MADPQRTLEQVSASSPEQPASNPDASEKLTEPCVASRHGPGQTWPVSGAPGVGSPHQLQEQEYSSLQHQSLADAAHPTCALTESPGPAVMLPPQFPRSAYSSSAPGCHPPRNCASSNAVPSGSKEHASPDCRGSFTFLAATPSAHARSRSEGGGTWATATATPNLKRVQQPADVGGAPVDTHHAVGSSMHSDVQSPLLDPAEPPWVQCHRRRASWACSEDAHVGTSVAVAGHHQEIEGLSPGQIYAQFQTIRDAMLERLAASGRLTKGASSAGGQDPQPRPAPELPQAAHSTTSTPSVNSEPPRPSQQPGMRLVVAVPQMQQARSSVIALEPFFHSPMASSDSEGSFMSLAALEEAQAGANAGEGTSAYSPGCATVVVHGDADTSISGDFQCLGQVDLAEQLGSPEEGHDGPALQLPPGESLSSGGDGHEFGGSSKSRCRSQASIVEAVEELSLAPPRPIDNVGIGALCVDDYETDGGEGAICEVAVSSSFARAADIAAAVAACCAGPALGPERSSAPAASLSHTRSSGSVKAPYARKLFPDLTMDLLLVPEVEALSPDALGARTGTMPSPKSLGMGAANGGVPFIPTPAALREQTATTLRNCLAKGAPFAVMPEQQYQALVAAAHRADAAAALHILTTACHYFPGHGRNARSAGTEDAAVPGSGTTGGGAPVSMPSGSLGGAATAQQQQLSAAAAAEIETLLQGSEGLYAMSPVERSRLFLAARYGAGQLREMLCMPPPPPLPLPSKSLDGALPSSVLAPAGLSIGCAASALALVEHFGVMPTLDSPACAGFPSPPPRVPSSNMSAVSPGPSSTVGASPLTAGSGTWRQASVPQVLVGPTGTQTAAPRSPGRQPTATQRRLRALITAAQGGNAQAAAALMSGFDAVDVNSVEEAATIGTTATGRTALHYAAEAGSFAVCQVLMHHGAFLNVRDKAGHTALDLASRKRQVAVAQLLKDEAARQQELIRCREQTLRFELAAGKQASGTTGGGAHTRTISAAGAAMAAATAAIGANAGGASPRLLAAELSGKTLLTQQSSLGARPAAALQEGCSRSGTGVRLAMPPRPWWACWACGSKTEGVV